MTIPATSTHDGHLPDGSRAIRPQHDLASVVARLLRLTESLWCHVPRRRDKSLPAPDTRRQPADFTAWGAVVASRRRRVAQVGHVVPDVGVTEVHVLGHTPLHDDPATD